MKYADLIELIDECRDMRDFNAVNEMFCENLKNFTAKQIGEALSKIYGKGLEIMFVNPSKGIHD